MREYLKFYIDGQWVDPISPKTHDVVNPATEEVSGRISLGSSADVDRAVKAARKAFATFSMTSRNERIELFESILAELKKRNEDMAKAVTEELGAPIWLSQRVHVSLATAHFDTTLKVLKDFVFREQRGSTLIVKEAIGVCGLITPWNWPLNQIACKVAPALAAGCTSVLKPSENSPYSAQIFAEVLAAAGVPAGVFNMIYGDGPTVGAAISSHPDIDMVSFTGSTRAGVEIARAAAPTIKRVCQELGGKSPNIILPDADLKTSVVNGVRNVMMNSGQTCTAPTRMLAPAGKMDEVIAIAKGAAEATSVGDPTGNAQMGPVVSKKQWDSIQALIETGVKEGATLVAGGPGRPEGLEKGYYVKPTVFAHVTPNMTIAREEIFGPVLSILSYDHVAQAVEMANDTEYGLAAYVSGEDMGAVKAVAEQLRAGRITLNNPAPDFMSPFGGYKKSGNGREWGDYGVAEFLEVKAIIGV